MSRKLGIGLGLGLILALAAGWFVLDRKVGRLASALDRELERVESLDAMVADATTRIDENYRRMEEARMRRESARERIEEAELVVSTAAEERLAADSVAEEALTREQEARAQADEARRQEEAERRRREEEWSRLGRALGKVAPTQRGEWVLTANLGSSLPKDKQKISLLAGILLAHHGYRATLEGADAAAIESYLKEAGIPADILTRGVATGPARLVLSDQILGPR